jgi:hypothetical protein
MNIMVTLASVVAKATDSGRHAFNAANDWMQAQQ